MGLAGLILCQILSHTDDGDEAVGQRCLDFYVDSSVALHTDLSTAVVRKKGRIGEGHAPGTAFRVAQNDMLAQPCQHSRGDLASVRTLILPVHRLCAQADVRGPYNLGYGCQYGKGWTQHPIHPLDLVELVPDAAHKS